MFLTFFDSVTQKTLSSADNVDRTHFVRNPIVHKMGKKQLPVCIPAVMNGRDAVHYSGIVLDFDHIDGSGPTKKTFDDFFGTCPFICSAHTSFTSDNAGNSMKVHAFFPFSVHVSVEEMTEIAQKLVDSLPTDLSLFVDSPGKKNQLYFVPAKKSGNDLYFWWESSGKQFVNEVLTTSNTVTPLKYSNLQLPTTGMIGEFCAKYTIHEIIRKFQLPYQPSKTSPNRYTYLHGKSEDGLIVYNEKWCFSHDATSPITDGHRKNPYSLLEGFHGNAMEIVKKDLQKDTQQQNLLKDTKKIYSIEQKILQKNTQKAIQKIAKSKKLFLNDLVKLIEVTCPTVFFDEFSRQIHVTECSWRKVQEITVFLESDIQELRAKIEEYSHKHVNTQELIHALTMYASRHAKNIVKTQLNSFTWDKKPRAETFFIDFLQAENTELTREITFHWLMGAVRRVFEPGCKFDSVPILIGAGGIGKSAIIELLGLGYSTSSISFFTGKDTQLLLTQSWIVEIPELAAIRRSSFDSVKSLISEQHDFFRAPYKRAAEKNPRHCVFIGTTNDTEFLSSDQGNRRFLPIQLYAKPSDSSKLQELLKQPEYIHQVWAEVVYKMKHGSPIIMRKTFEVEAEKKRNKYMKQDATAEFLFEAINKNVTTNTISLMDIHYNILNKTGIITPRYTRIISKNMDMLYPRAEKILDNRQKYVWDITNPKQN